MSEENKQIELRSDEVEDILGKVPGWITRNGILMLFIIVLLLLVGAWIFKIPDVKKAEIYVTSLQPPADIESRTDGKIEQLFVSDNERVSAGQVLAVIENPADFSDVEALKDRLNAFNLQEEEQLFDLEMLVNGEISLGMIQPDYADFNKYCRDYFEFVQLNYHNRKIDLLKEELEQYRDYSENLDMRAFTLREEYGLARKQYQRDSSLYLQGVVSESDFERSKSQMLTSRAGWQEMLSLKAENKIRMAGIREQILEMELKRQDQQSTIVSAMEEALNRLKASIATWEKMYVIVAPITGDVTFNRFWSENQNVKNGEQVMTIIPGDGGALVGRISLPLAGAGEVNEGNPVNIRFEDYPYLEYGMVRGIVDNISRVPQDNYYTVEVRLPDGLTTFYGMKIGYSQNMHGQAEILTDKMRLLQRIFNPVRSAVSRQREMQY
ncbi:MAG: HlyD family secretion protein [Bacteroidales bacterium]|nr:HlyD family secretion protein [Bacteroidales bacterium]